MGNVIDEIKSFQGDIAVRAGAGAGKTTALVEKYMAELTMPRPEGYLGVDRIAAITFTEKAAAEMSARVRQKLTERIEELRKRTPVAGSTANLGEDQPDWSQDQKLLNHLIRQRQNIKSAYISTIHAFCARLLYENQIAAGVDPGFSVISEMEARAMLDAKAVETVIQRLRQGDAGVRRLVRDHGFMGMGNSDGLKEKIIWLIPLLRAANMSTERLLAMRQSFVSKLPPPGEIDLARLRAILQRFCGLPPRDKEHKFAQALLLNEGLFDGRMDLGLAGQVMALAEDLEKSVVKRVSYIEGKKAFEDSLEAVALARKICGPVIEKAVAQDMETFLGLVERTMGAYAEEKQSRSSLDYNDLQEKARDLLAGPGPTLGEYRSRLQKALIDEFQDTDKLQARIINLLAAPGEGRLFLVGDVKQSIYGFRGADPGVFLEQAKAIEEGGGKELLLVDSWRATPGLTEFFNSFFAGLMGEGASGEQAWFDPRKDSLKAVRSAEGVQTGIYRIMAPAEKIADSRAQEAAAIAAEIKRQVAAGDPVEGSDGAPRPVDYGDMALLLRSFGNHEIYESALRRAGIPYLVVKGRGFYECQEIKDMANLLWYISRPADTLALVSTLRSPLVGLSDETILRLFHDPEGGRRENPISRQAVEGSGVEGDERCKLEEFIQMVAEWSAVWERVGISEMLEMILSRTGYGAVMMSRHNGERILANIFKLIELARTYESDWSKGFHNFALALNEMISSSPDEAKADILAGEENVVKIMTVHQSKGLEFPVVFVGDAGFSPPATRGAMVFSPSAGLGMKAHELATGRWHAGPSFHAAKAGVEKERQDELKRLLYVAMTRARDRLIVSGPAEGKGQWSKWLTSVCADRGIEMAPVPVVAPAAEPSPAAGVGMDENPMVRSILEGVKPPHAPQPPAAPPLAMGDDVASLRLSVTALASFTQCPRIFYYQSMGDLAAMVGGASLGGEVEEWADMRDVGTRVHKALETAPMGKGAGKAGLGIAIARALEGMDAKLIESAIASVDGAFSAAPLDGIFEVDPMDIIRETPLAMKASGPGAELILYGAPDLVWRQEGKWRLVDYKYSKRPREEGRYVFQAGIYAMAMMEAFNVASMEVSVIYLREGKRRATTFDVDGPAAASLRGKALEAAEKISRLEGRPLENWPGREKKFCKACDCAYIGNCHGSPA
ncbi:MAG: UvrD-helicase domain-containing protein [Nitrospinota bacterium]|nr:UvrD-helicase domain-containing protein [Nitrospinota bacterium]